MVSKESEIYGESYFPVQIGQGLYTSELPSNIPDGFSAKVFNFIATGDSLENRVGIRQTSVDYTCNVTTSPDRQLWRLGMGDPINSSNVALAWGDRAHDTGVFTMNLIRGYHTVAAGDGYIRVTMPAATNGFAYYNGRIYFLMGDAGRIYRIATVDWATDAVTYSSIPSGSFLVSTASGLTAFKDRLWCHTNDTIYFTDIANPFPETWVSTNFIPVRGPAGRTQIWRIQPYGNKLLVFTGAGLFSLTVEGPPESWILRMLDSDSISSSQTCAFESKGIVYYANTQGVWATNGSSVAKLSGTIEDQFFQAKGNRIITCNPLEDGILLCISKVADNFAIDAPNTRIFYTKTDPVAWAEWGIHSESGTENEFGSNRITSVMSVSPKVGTYLNTDPTSYALVCVSNDTGVAVNGGKTQLVIFDGGVDQLKNALGVLVETPVELIVKSKYMDGGNPYRMKQAMKAYVEMFTSDTTHNFEASWDIDSTTGPATEIKRAQTIEFTIGQASNLLQIVAGFPFRRCALTLKTFLQADTSQVKIKDIAMVLRAARSVEEIVQ